MKIFLSFCYLLIPCFCFAQIPLSGVVKSKKDGAKIAYVNVGIRNKNFGTISDEKGRFNLIIPDSMTNDKLTFSCVGFEELSMPISSLKNKSSLNVSLDTKTFKLAEVKISNKKPKIKKLGITGYTPMFSGNISWYKNNDIAEHGRLIKIKTPSRLLKANAVVWTTKKDNDSISFRLNIYAVENDFPGHRLTERSFVKKFSLKNPTLTFDLSKENIVLDQNFIIAFEYLPDPKNLKSPTDFRLKVGSSGAYVRNHSLGIWQKTKGGSPAIFVEVEQ